MRRAITRALDKNVGWGMGEPLRGSALTQSCGNHTTIGWQSLRIRKEEEPIRRCNSGRRDNSYRAS
jgi:hypothetical protein